ncbi:MAG TPA: hypothetical protein VF731_01725 [Solirubrobacterales bacterium]
MSAFPDPSLVRRGLDLLLAAYPHLDVLSIEWQIDGGSELAPGRRWAGPWVLVELGQPSDHIDELPAWAVWKFAIWRTTGSVYSVGADGAVGDDPILQLAEAQ